MKVLLITFSGTNNTFICANFIKKYFLNNDHEVDHYLYKANKEFNYNLDDYDLIGIGYPIYGFNIPKPLYKFLLTLKVNKPINYFIYKVSGEPFKVNSASSSLIVNKLKKKGFNLIYEKHFLMPYNIIFEYNDSIKKEMYLYLEKLTEVMVEDILNNTYLINKYSLMYRFISFLFRLVWIAGPVNSKLTSINYKKCIMCKECILNCPTNSLYLNKKNKIKVKSSCAICMKCAHDCPKDAFRFGFLHLMKINGKFNYNKLLNDPNIKGNYINKNTKGYFKHFKKYFKEQNEILNKHNKEIPSVFLKEEIL